MEALFIITTLYVLICTGFILNNSKLYRALATLWIAVVSGLAIADFFQNIVAIPPRMMYVLVPPIVIIFLLAKKLDVSKIDLKLLTAVHICRIPVEIVLFVLFGQKLLPEMMTFSGWNFDIIMGITAIPVLWYLSNSQSPNKNLLLAWNVIGILMLLIIIVISVLSSPLPIQQLAFDQPNLAMIRFPYVLLPSFVVPAVLLSHFLAIKQVLVKDLGAKTA